MSRLQPHTALPVATRVTGNALCEARVHLSSVETKTYKMRVFNNQQRGIPVNQCGAVARFSIQLPGHTGRCLLCNSHAGQAALAMLLGDKVDV